MSQIDLFTGSVVEPMPPFQAHSATSYEAAVSVQSSAAQQRERVYRYIVANGPVTDEQVALGLELDGNSVRPRRRELQKAGRIVADGTGVTVRGRSAVRWRAGSAFDETVRVMEVPGL